MYSTCLQCCSQTQKGKGGDRNNRWYLFKDLNAYVILYNDVHYIYRVLQLAFKHALDP